jgi:hypothetical protein
MPDHPQSGANAYGWTDAWDTYDDPELSDVKKYVLPEPDDLGEDERFNARVLHEGTRFWDTEERYLITVVAVKTKVYRGVVGPKGEEGEDNVFYETDWNPPRPRGAFSEPYHPHRDDEPFCTRATEFAERVATGQLVPHRGNGIRVPP